MSGKELFEASVLQDASKKAAFYRFSALVYRQIQSIQKASITHIFLRRLSARGQLIRCYTQNIDGIERTAKLTMDFTDYAACRVVQLHGDITMLRCTICGYRGDWGEDTVETALGGEATDCPNCFEINKDRRSREKRPRSAGELRPDILLYDETSPNDEAVPRCLEKDIARQPTALLVMGTSLTIPGCQHIFRQLAQAVHDSNGSVLWINPKAPSTAKWGDIVDQVVLMESDQFITAVEGMWDADLATSHERYTPIKEILRLRRRNLTGEQVWQGLYDSL